MMAKRERKRERGNVLYSESERWVLPGRKMGRSPKRSSPAVLALPPLALHLPGRPGGSILQFQSWSCTALHCACKGPGGSHALPHPTSPCIVLYMFRTWIRHPAALLCSSTALCCLNCIALAAELLHCTCKGPAVRLQCDKPLLHQCQLKSPQIRPTLSWIVNGKWHKTCLTSAQIYLDIWIEVKQIYSQSTLILSKVQLMDEF